MIKLNGVSVALFGSFARCDADDHSDKDLLLVSDDIGQLTKGREIFENQGYSCSTYTWAKLTYLSIGGSLFVKHLVDESQIINDPNDRLQTLLRNFSPKESYAKEQNDGREIFELLHYTPNSHLGLSWAHDVLFVSFRTMAVPFLAERKIYKFSLDEICAELRDFTSLAEADHRLLQDIRRGKQMYRKENIVRLLSQGEIITLSKRIAFIFHCNSTLEFVAIDASIARSLEEIKANDRFGYFTLRSVERALIAGIEKIPDMAQDPRVVFLRTCISRPSAYSFSAGRAESKFQTIAIEVLELFLNS